MYFFVCKNDFEKLEVVQKLKYGMKTLQWNHYPTNWCKKIKVLELNIVELTGAFVTYGMILEGGKYTSSYS